MKLEVPIRFEEAVQDISCNFIYFCNLGQLAVEFISTGIVIAISFDRYSLLTLNWEKINSMFVTGTIWEAAQQTQRYLFNVEKISQ